MHISVSIKIIFLMKAETLTVMGVIPVCPGLIGSCEGIQERIVGSDWALGNACSTVRPRTVRLKYTVPMLHDMNAKSRAHQQDVFSNLDTYDARAP